MALSADGFFCGQIACPGDETEVIVYSSQTNNLQAISYGVLISDIFFGMFHWQGFASENTRQIRPTVSRPSVHFYFG